jgi:hypothetical protein
VHPDAHDYTSQRLDLFVENNPTWFIRKEPFSPHDSQFELQQIDVVSQGIVHYMVQLHQGRERTCESNNYVLLQHWASGFGASVAEISIALQIAFLTNRTVVLMQPPQIWQYIEPTDASCEEKHTPECYFHSVYTTACTSYALGMWSKMSGDAQALANKFQHTNQFWSYHYENNIPNLPSLMHPWYRMNPFVYIVMGRPKYFVRKYVKEIALHAGLTRPFDGLHVRHGDKWLQAALIPFSHYQKRMQLARERMPGPELPIWLATDNYTLAMNESHTWAKIVFNRNAQAKLPSNVYPSEYFEIRTKASGNRTLMFLDSYADIAILSQCRIFVGTKSSGYSQKIATMKSFITNFARQIIMI